MTSNKHPITFSKAALNLKECIFQWLEEPHVKEFWDNSPNFRDDVINFMEGRKEPSPYWNGIFDYWIGFFGNDPFCLIMTSEIKPLQNDLLPLWKENLSKKGKTCSIDFMIGNTKYFGKGLAAPTLKAFTKFIHETIDPAVNTFLIDPAETNPRAKHVYEKAGFKIIAEFKRDFMEQKDVKHFLLKMQL